MKTGIRFVPAAAFAAALCAGCGPRKPEDDPPRAQRLVRVEGVQACHNFFFSEHTWVAVEPGLAPLIIPARSGDVLSVQVGDKTSNYFLLPYRASDGDALRLQAAPFKLLLRGDPVALQLTNDPASWVWLESANPRELARLRAIQIEDAVDASRLALLQKIAEVNPGITLQIKNPEATLKSVLALFHPQHLLFDPQTARGVILDPETRDLLASRRNLECFYLRGEIPDDLAYLDRMAALRSIHFFDSDSKSRNPLLTPLRLDRLDFLALEGELVVATLNRLERVRVGFALPEEVQKLLRLKGLRALNLWISEISDLDPLEDLNHLEFIGFPKEINPESFSRFLSAHQGLRQVELIKCKHIQDLAPLLELPNLEHLVLIDSKADLAPLSRMEKLRLLVLDKGVFERSGETVQALRKALPECAIVAGEGICLGSGWILLLVPAVFALCLLPRRREPGACQRNGPPSIPCQSSRIL
jgi:hypothetical protein